MLGRETEAARMRESNPSSRSGGSAVRAAPRPGLPAYVLRLGAVGGVRPARADVAVVVGAVVPSFSLTPCEGYSRGAYDPGWVIVVAHEAPELIASLAETLRARFAQEGVGIEAHGRYLRCRADHGPSDLAAELWGLEHRFMPAYFQTRFATATAPVKWPERFAIITAWATTGERWTDERNRMADERLRQLLLGRNLRHQRITGESPDGQHAEPGWWVETDLADAVQIGRAFRQDAVYWIEGDALSVHACADDRAAPVGRFTARLRAAAT
jgi:hypothetical protein